MKRTYVFYFAVILTLFTISNISAQDYEFSPEHHSHKIHIDNSTDYLPEYLNGIYLGMPLAEFANIKDTLFLTKIKLDSLEWIGYKEYVNDDGINNIFYKFDSVPDSTNDTMPLFEIIINFMDIEQADDFVTRKFHEPLIKDIPTFKQWFLKTDKNFVLIVKQINNQVKLIGTIAGAEWDPNY
ncbi:MAG: hypothetical protein ACUVQP_03770 [Bacteroidales bacterium]